MKIPVKQEKYYGDEHYYTKVSRIGIMPHSAILQNGIKIAVEFAMKKDFSFTNMNTFCCYNDIYRV